MTNPHKGDVDLIVGDKKYILRYSHSALVDLENVLNKNLMAIMREMSDIENMRIGTIAALLWAGLRKHQPTLTMDDACTILDDLEGGAKEAIDVIGTAFQKAFNAPGSRSTNPTTIVGMAGSGNNGTGMRST